MPTLFLIPNYYKLNIIKLRIRNEDHYFIVDTGASHTHLTSTLVNDRNVSNTHTIKIICMTGTRNSSIVEYKFNFCGVSITSFAVDDTICMINQDKENYSYSGLIGQDILRQFSRVIIDYVKETITFEK